MTLHRYIYNRWIPLRGFRCLTVAPWIFVRSEYRGRLHPSDRTHEEIHLRQQMEVSPLLFLAVYVLEYLLKLLCTFDRKRAYRSIGFEQEAYANESDAGYPDGRRHFSWIGFVFTLTKSR